MLESVREREKRRLAREAREVTEEEGALHRQAQREANEGTVKALRDKDAQGLVEFACECTSPDCDRTVRTPPYVYRRLLEAGDQYLVHTGHHAFARYRTIVASGLMTIEEPA